MPQARTICQLVPSLTLIHFWNERRGKQTGYEDKPLVRYSFASLVPFFFLAAVYNVKLMLLPPTFPLFIFARHQSHVSPIALSSLIRYHLSGITYRT